MTTSDDPKRSTGAYLRLVFLDPVSLVGLAVLASGLALVAISAPGTSVHEPLLGGSLMLVGTVLFALGYTRAQWGLRKWR
ncbi:hypothetical protein BG842_05785 [Haladaptatus sp. W1]|uniref:hypothetical protein n=1 Tax=Haladaptatus sp. W1 TaxID=1897478 RepID=UPI000849BD54|nr:hypothetical protein [Haladaptatus sp. W1]ODR80282.1 hypothetical protein BG842_05785 [Haladaptatus sp. W1]